jgi:hypothetical protein
VWRAVVVSTSIEIVQVVTRARATDVDDVMINVAGAVVGYAVYKAAASLVCTSSAGTRLLERLSVPTPHEPLRAAAALSVTTAAIVVPFMVSSIFGSTLGEGLSGIEGDAVGRLPRSTIVARAGIDTNTFVVVRAGSDLMLVEYERVLPGRYTWISESEPVSPSGSFYNWNLTAFNIAREELPAVVVWGTSLSDAKDLLVNGNGVNEKLAVPGGDFAVAFLFDVYAYPDDDGVLDDFGFAFVSPSGRDVTDGFSALR